MNESEPELQRKALAYIRRHCMNAELWQYTVIGNAHVEIAAAIGTQPGELPLVSCLVSGESWYIFTTRRIVSRCRGTTRQLLAPSISGKHYGNFKGHARSGSRAVLTEIATLENPETGVTLELEFETMYASMAPIYACKFWERRSKQRASKKVSPGGGDA